MGGNQTHNSANKHSALILKINFRIFLPERF